MECSICMSGYSLSDRVPKVLKCGHTFCAVCIAQLRLSSGRVHCPTCRQDTADAEVRTNFAVQDALAAGNTGGAAVSVPQPAPQGPILEAPTTEDVDVAVTVAALPPFAALDAVLGGAPAAAEGSVDVMVSLKPPEGCNRTPVDICCIVDVSDSMGTEAMAQDGAGASVSHGLALLDIVKHALRTIVHNLKDCDRLALVAYANSARVVAELTVMSEAGRRDVERRLQLLILDGMTNLWAGLQMGVELLGKAASPGRLQHVLLLTDGVPNLNPPRGIIPMLKRLKDKAPGGNLPCTINTFGFGYELDSELLSEIARISQGAYAFIPDAGFVGTVFVNAMTNLLVTMARNATLTLEPLNDASFAMISDRHGSPVHGELPWSTCGAHLKVDLATLQFGQSRDVVVRMRVPDQSRDWLRVQVCYETRALNSAQERVVVAGGHLHRGGMEAAVQVNRVRAAFVGTIGQAMKTAKLTGLEKLQGKALPLPEAQVIIEALDAAIASSGVCQTEAVEALVEDLRGQVAEAFSKEEWYTKWGIHFLPSLMHAHSAQQCNNFKDPGVQHYGGELFNSLRDTADDIFLELPPPEPSARPPPAPPAPPARASASAPAAAAPAAPLARSAPVAAVSMATYYDRYAG